ncbi:MAG: tRNA (guanosine(37)-N1)-methyltransferase TrmD [Alicyclobacillaceae bacterium]|nr:tRNA (guanosine(37)-N1)-methyltransferase TrmD [Alicyclobacillaceae bacterium]
MNIVILTLFPEMFDGVLHSSILRRAQAAGELHVELVNFRDYAEDKHRTVDDYPFGGDAGMLLKPHPLFRAVESLQNRTPELETARIVLLSPQGRVFNQSVAGEYALEDNLILICGHYEGVDDRVRAHLATEELSLGDFVLTGGEIAAMAVMDAVARLRPGVLGNAQSLVAESHQTGLLEYPQFTRPAMYRGFAVPDTLMSGNHAKVEEWRHRHALYRTWSKRPELLRQRELSDVEREWIRLFEAGDFQGAGIEVR